MKLKGKKEDEETKQLPITEAAEKSPKKKKAKEYEGSRWAAVVLLLLTLIAGVYFTLMGSGGWRAMTRFFQGFGGEKVIIFEKN